MILLMDCFGVGATSSSSSSSSSSQASLSAEDKVVGSGLSRSMVVELAKKEETG